MVHALKTITAFFIFAFVSIVSADAQVQREYTVAELEKMERLFDEANALAEQKKFAESLVKYKEILAIEPNALGPLYNAGTAAFTIGEFELALDLWKRLKVGDPNDMQARAKLVQVYQSLGRLDERDSERAELFKLRKEGKSDELADPDFYVREQSVMSGRRVMVFEHFELKGNRALRYVFYALNDDGKPEFHISLGSYDLTNSVWRSTTKPTPKEGERLFHLDGYFEWGHATYGMFPKEPTYDETRKMVIEILAKNVKPVSSTTVVTAAPKPKENEKP